MNINRKLGLGICAIAGVLLCTQSNAQERLYANTFPLKDVKLLDSPFKHARDLNIQTLLKYDVDRLLAPYLKEAGLKPKKPSYTNWEGLDGHIAGHYLSALSMNYAATGNAACKERMDYMLAELKKCQEANTKNHPDWGTGYAGGVPNSAKIWSAFKNGDFGPFHAAWVPWYNVHKMYAGLRDAWMYGGAQEGKDLFLKFCDWGIQITSQLSEDQMQSMLNTEQGGMNEMFADAYQMTRNAKYLTAARRFSHRMLLDPMSSDVDNLDNKHANTQIPKAIGFERIGELSHDPKYIEAGNFFWQTVTTNRTLAFGGNSRREFFPSAAACTDYVNDVEGPESCNSYNMLKLTAGLFREHPQAKYMDYYERTLYNHILSTQNPETGGYVYFTPVRPRHYRVYSAPNEAMWCCLGSGMENHGKYNEFIYTHQHDSLFLNLFIPSVLTWQEKGVQIKQETNFPFEEQTKLLVEKGKSRFTLMVRYPSWVKDGALQIRVNGKAFPFTAHPSSYIGVTRLWKKGDIVEIELPMHNTVTQLPNVPNYVAFMHGPIVLGAKTGTQDLAGLIADDSRWGHIPGGKRLPLDKAPILVDDKQDLPGKLIPEEGKPLHFTFADVKMLNPEKLELQPFYQIHDARYMMYWMTLNQQQSHSYLDSISRAEKEKLALQERTVDAVSAGEQQPEADHAMQEKFSRSGNYHDEFWRSAAKQGYFDYQLSTADKADLKLMVRYSGDAQAKGTLEIYIDGKKLASEDHSQNGQKAGFYNVEYAIPESMLQGKSHIRVRFQSLPNTTTGQIFEVRLLKK